jgi:ribosome-binding protein aMBF1 (putative translation factor)
MENRNVKVVIVSGRVVRSRSVNIAPKANPLEKRKERREREERRAVMNLPNICEDGEDETGWTGKETAARIQNDRVTLARLEQRGYMTGSFFPVGTATKRGTLGGYNILTRLKRQRY